MKITITMPEDDVKKIRITGRKPYRDVSEAERCEYDTFVQKYGILAIRQIINPLEKR